MMERRKVSERVKTLSLYDLDGFIDDAIALLEGLKKEFDGEELILDVQEEYDAMLLVLYKVREETDEEYEKRVRKAEKAKETRRKNLLNKKEERRQLCAELKAESV